MKSFWQQLNRPLVILLIGLGLWPLVNAWEQRLAVHSTADAVFAELNRAEDQMNAQAKKSGIKNLVETFVSQFVDGFTSAMDRAGQGQASKTGKYAATLPQITLTDVTAAPSGWSGKEKIVGLIHNNSAVPISDVHLNLMLFAADGHLLNVLDESLNELKLLEPGKTVGFSVDHDLSDTYTDPDTDNSSSNSDDADADADDAPRKKDKAADAARKAAADAHKAAENAKKAAENSRRAAKVTAQIVGFSVEEPEKPKVAQEAKASGTPATSDGR